ncbi:MAG TPA: hypothetical protein VLK25_10715 [Allosphingosinicella sp.]|nr:hypothetical protein [Allosphingosinicella sp.]
MAGTWSTLTNQPPDKVATAFLLTDGTVLAQGFRTNKWYRLTPDVSGSYVNGAWTTMADSVHGPLYYASGILRDGRVIVVGGEYDFQTKPFLLGAEVYDPVANSWTTLPVPAGWVRIGDAPGCVLPDGRFIVGQVLTLNTAIYDPATNAWTASANKLNTVGEESWSLLPDGTIHAVDCSNPPNAEKYIIASNQWVGAGQTPQVLVDGISEIGASVLLPDGRLFVIGATGYTALYTPPPVANQPGSWVQGPSIPQVNPNQPLGTVDAPATVLPNGRVLFSAGPITSPATFQAPTYFFEYDPVANSIAAVANPATSGAIPYEGRLLMLPNGQALYTAYSKTVCLYSPGGSPDPVWRPTITSCPTTLRRGKAYNLYGRQLNGLTQCVYYGNDATQATNYPIVRLEKNGSSDVYYCRTRNFSTMGLQTGTIIHNCQFVVPSTMPTGNYCLRVIANGIATKACHNVSVTNKLFKEVKAEIKEKLELIEVDSKRLQDIAQKRMPDVDDKINEGYEWDIYERIQDEWAKTMQILARGIEESHEQLSRTFIAPEERPMTGAPEPEIEEIKPPVISAEAARLGQEKHEEDETRKLSKVERDAEDVHELMHMLSRSGGKINAVDAATTRRYLAEMRAAESKQAAPAARKASRSKKK